jgi:hypothetical protein
LAQVILLARLPLAVTAVPAVTGLGDSFTVIAAGTVFGAGFATAPGMATRPVATAHTAAALISLFILIPS